MRNESPLEAQTLVQTTASLLRSSGRLMQAWSLMLALGAVLILGLRPVVFAAWWLLLLSLLAAALQLYAAVRTQFDAELFSALGADHRRYQALDKLLARLGLRSGDTPHRPLMARAQGALRWSRWQLRWLLLQTGLLVAGLVVLQPAAR